MRKSLLNKTTGENLVRRVGQLQPDSAPLWGSMTATEMLLHCNRINEQLLTSSQIKKGTRLKQYVGRLIFLYFKQDFPKNVRTPRRNETKGQIDAAAFENEKQHFIALVSRFASHTAPIEAPHPYFGDLGTKEWGIFGYKHLDHHLRQFGV